LELETESGFAPPLLNVPLMDGHHLGRGNFPRERLILSQAQKMDTVSANDQAIKKIGCRRAPLRAALANHH
jgi:hypothetical protein